MPFSNPLTVTVATVAKQLTRINMDNYGSEYLLKEATQEFRIKIRHTKESPQKDGTQFDRHNVELTQTVYPTATAPKITRQVYVVLRNSYLDSIDPVKDLGVAFSALLTATNYDNLISWQS